uniref:Uncharacterized protein n=1 Tax=Plectus sambesii TaxID=2011161 RepID=A0A914VX76_9BILA
MKKSWQVDFDGGRTEETATSSGTDSSGDKRARLIDDRRSIRAKATAFRWRVGRRGRLRPGLILHFREHTATSRAAQEGLVCMANWSHQRPRRIRFAHCHAPPRCAAVEGVTWITKSSHA